MSKISKPVKIDIPLTGEFLTYEKFLCNCCGKPVKASTYADVIRADKLCTNCATESITGGLKRIKHKNDKDFKIRKTDVEKGNFGYGYPKQKQGLLGLRREDAKHRHKKPLSEAQKQSIRAADDAKWERIRYAYKVSQGMKVD